MPFSTYSSKDDTGYDEVIEAYESDEWYEYNENGFRFSVHTKHYDQQGFHTCEFYDFANCLREIEPLQNGFRLHLENKKGEPLTADIFIKEIQGSDNYSVCVSGKRIIIFDNTRYKDVGEVIMLQEELQTEG
jgi:hypothetical protein